VSCCQKVCVNPADPAPEKGMSSDELQHIIVAHYAQGREFAEQINSLGGLSKMTERQLTDEERMRHHAAVPEFAHQRWDGSSKVIDPDGRVDEDHRDVFVGRRRRGALARLSLPPRAARRRALCWTMSARKPA
jgi:hypothetical protein